MKIFHPNETMNDEVPMDGKADGMTMKRSAIKLSEGPKIMVAMPIGAKPVSSVLQCPQCEERGEERQHFQVEEGFRPEGLVPIQFMIAQMNWLAPLNVTMAYSFKTRMRSAAARQVLTMDTLRVPTVKYIFYVDDDTLIPPMGLYTLYNLMEQNPTWGAVTGVYTTRQDPPEPLVYTDHGAGAAWDIELGPGAKPTKIMGAGAGCLLARVDAIKDWMKDNPDDPIWCDSSEYPATNGGRVTWGHDVRFIRNLTEAGWPCYVDGRVLCTHLDIKTGKHYVVPSTAPGFKKTQDRQSNINTAEYWDALYGQEGINTWRQYPEMFQKIADELPKHGSVLELGCGVGVLGSKLTAERGAAWMGYDISPKAVAMCRARFLRAHELDLRNLSEQHLDNFNFVVMSETLEHLEREVGVRVLDVIRRSGVLKLIITTPNNCMPPEEVKEHTALFNEEYVDDMLADAGFDRKEWGVRYQLADDHHLMTVVERA